MCSSPPGNLSGGFGPDIFMFDARDSIVASFECVSSNRVSRQFHTPPVTSTVSPVTKSASAEAKKQHAASHRAGAQTV